MKDFYFFVPIPLQQFQKVNKAESDQTKREVQCLKPSHAENFLMWVQKVVGSQTHLGFTNKGSDAQFHRFITTFWLF